MASQFKIEARRAGSTRYYVIVRRRTGRVVRDFGRLTSKIVAERHLRALQQREVEDAQYVEAVRVSRGLPAKRTKRAPMAVLGRVV